MNHAFSIYSLILILFLTIFHRVQSTNDIVQDTCKKLVPRDLDFDFDFCVKSHGSDPESRKVDFEGLGLNGLKLLQANLAGTTEYIKQLLKQKLEQSLLKSLSLCLDAYLTSEGEDMTPTDKERRYFDVIIWVGGVTDSEDICETQESEKKGTVPPLTKRNADILQLSIIVLGITAILRGGA
ncbi:hypothetical protein ACJRO7_030357 [Eucalyptus globulus]|uniref:Pectinesterase inhibitor domain-containing protein n=1 Tax=Eucalyptus globulus TaxID=34317 RepID=A0ABD3JIQ3_EUCGL